MALLQNPQQASQQVHRLDLMQAAVFFPLATGGADGVEYECYGHLPDQFLSPLTNALSGPYGGEFDNRLRFATEMLTACRKRVGDDFILGIRYVADESEPGGIPVEVFQQIIASDVGCVIESSVIRDMIKYLSEGGS